MRKFLDQCEKKDEKYSHLEQADLDKVKKCLKEKSEWFDKQLNAQNKLKKHENPVVLTSQIQQSKQVGQIIELWHLISNNVVFWQV